MKKYCDDPTALVVIGATLLLGTLALVSYVWLLLYRGAHAVP